MKKFKDGKKSMLIKLESWEYEWANSVGIRRFTANWEKKDAAHYDKSRMEDDRTAQVAAAACELAVAKATNRYWSGSVWPANEHHKNKNRADVSKNIEVRRIREGNSVAVRKHQVGLDLILIAARATTVELNVIEILGWIKYDEAWDLSIPSNYDPETTRKLDVKRLNALDPSHAVI